MPSPDRILKDGAILLLSGLVAALVWEDAMFAAGFAASGAIALLNVWLITRIVARMIASARDGADSIASAGVSAAQLTVGFTLKVFILGAVITGLVATFPLFAVLAGFNAVLLGIILRGLLMPWAGALQEA